MKNKKQVLKELFVFIYVWTTIFSITLTNFDNSLAQINDNERQATYEESKKSIVENQSKLKKEIAKTQAALALQVPDKRESSPSFAQQQLADQHNLLI